MGPRPAAPHSTESQSLIHIPVSGLEGPQRGRRRLESHSEIAARPGLVSRPPGLFPVLSTQVPPEQSCPCGELCLPSSRTSPQEEGCLGRGLTVLPLLPPPLHTRVLAVLLPQLNPAPPLKAFQIILTPSLSFATHHYCFCFLIPQYLQILHVIATTLNLSSTSQSDHCPPHSFTWQS